MNACSLSTTCSFTRTIQAGDSTVVASQASSSYSSSSNYFITLAPPSTSYKIRVIFQNFDTESGYDTVYLYSGDAAGAFKTSAATPSTLQPLFSFSGSILPPMVDNTVCGLPLTVQLYSDTSVTSSGIKFTAHAIACPLPVVATFAGQTIQLNAFIGGYADGLGTNAMFDYIEGISFAQNGMMYVADAGNNRIRTIDSSGYVTTLAGKDRGFGDGQGTYASFDQPKGVSIAPNGNLYVADSDNHRIRAISPTGFVYSFVGGAQGFADGYGTNARFSYPAGLSISSTDGIMYVADTNNHRIRAISPDGMVSTIAGKEYGFDDGLGTNARFRFPEGVSVTSSSAMIYVVDTGNHRIRSISPSGSVQTIAGQASGGLADGQGTNAKFYYPYGISVSPGGVIYVADKFNHRIRSISPTGFVSTVAGRSSAWYENGVGTNARFYYPGDIAVSPSGVIYVADTNSYRVRSITYMYI